MEAVKVFKLIMIKFNNVGIRIGKHLRYRNQLTWFIRKVNGERKDTATQYETFIDHRGNSKYVDITTADDGYNLFTSAV